MPDMLQKDLTAITGAGTGDKTDVRNMTALSAFARVAGGTSIDIAFEGTVDPYGVSGWKAIATRDIGGGSYATTAATVNAGAFRNFMFDPADNINWVRPVTTNSVGTTPVTTITIAGEQ